MACRYTHCAALVLAVLAVCLLAAAPALAENFEANKLFERARFEFQDNNPRDALDFLEKAMALEPNKAEHYNLLGLIQASLKKPEKAAAAFRRALALDPKGQKGAIIELANALSAQGDNRNALKFYQEARASFPQRPDLLVNIGLAHLNLAEYAPAQAAFEQLMEMDPGLKPYAMYHLALISHRRDRLDEAQATLEAALALKPGEDVEKVIRQFLTALEKEKKLRKPYSAFATILLQYDDNVSSNPLEAAAFYSGVGVSPPTNTGDFSLGFTVGDALKFINQRTREAGVTMTLMGSIYQNLHENNMTGVVLGAYYSQMFKRLAFKVSADWSYFWAAGLDKMAAWGLTPSLTYTLTQADRVDLMYNAQWRIMTDLAKDAAGNKIYQKNTDSLHHTLAANYYHVFSLASEKNLVLRGGLVYEYDDPKEVYGAKNQSISVYDLQAGLTFPIAWGINGDVGLSYGWTYYPYFQQTGAAWLDRTDSKFTCSVKFTKQLNQYISLMFMYTFLYNDSNLVHQATGVDVYEFQRNVFTFAVSGVY